MTTYRVTNPASGIELGDYLAESAAAALDACARDAGYQDYADACRVTGTDELVAEEVAS